MAARLKLRVINGDNLEDGYFTDTRLEQWEDKGFAKLVDFVFKYTATPASSSAGTGTKPLDKLITTAKKAPFTPAFVEEWRRRAKRGSPMDLEHRVVLALDDLAESLGVLGGKSASDSEKEHLVRP